MLVGTRGGGEVVRGGLADPEVRSRIVHARDELRRYHQMRENRRSLEQQVAGAEDSPQLAEVSLWLVTSRLYMPVKHVVWNHQVQAELSRTVEELHRTGPVLLELVAQVQHHLSQNQP